MTLNRYNLFEDAQSLLVAPLFFAFAILMLREAGLLTGGPANGRWRPTA